MKNKTLIIVGTFFSLVVSIVIYFFVLDLIYFSSATIKSSNQKGGLLSGLDAFSDLGNIDEISGLGGGKSAKELGSYMEILTSRRCLEELIKKFDLMNRDEYKFMEDAIKDFKTSRMELKEERISGVLYVGIYDKDPVLAQKMVDFLLSELDKINIELSVQNAKNNREFIEKRYYQAKSDLASAEDSLKSFQVIYGVAPDLQFKAAVQSQVALDAELKSEEVKLDVLNHILSADQPEVKTEIAKVNSLKQKISEIQTSTDLNELLRLGNSPQIIMNYLRLQREVEIQNKILTFVLPLFEQAKIEEKRDTPTIQILDKPYVAERKTKPKRLTMVVLWTFVGFIVVCTFSIGRYRWNQFKQSSEFKETFQK